jgi:hypothetical protein
MESSSQYIWTITQQRLRRQVQIFHQQLTKTSLGEEIPGIDPGATCHRLNIDPNVKYLAQQRRRQSQAEAAKTVVKDLVQAKFILEINYTE